MVDIMVWMGDMVHHNNNIWMHSAYSCSWCCGWSGVAGSRPICFSLAATISMMIKVMGILIMISMMRILIRILLLSSYSMLLPSMSHSSSLVSPSSSSFQFCAGNFRSLVHQGLIIKGTRFHASIIHIHEKSISAGLQEI